MEFGIKINDERDLVKITNLDRYRYIYFGNEFCERKIPSIETSFKIFDFCEKNKKIPVLLTPPLTEAGLKTIKGLVQELKKFYIEFEITINDYGLIYFLEGERQIKTNCGRLLIQDTKNGGLHLNPNFLELFNKTKITRFETDIVSKDLIIPKNQQMTLYLGNHVLSVTKRCVYPKSDTDGYDYKVGGCKKECLNSIVVRLNQSPGAVSEEVSEEVYLVGNAEVLMGDLQINDYLKDKLDRVVIFPGVKANL